jgi:hypothetical protein
MKTTQGRNKLFLAGMLGMVLAFGLVLAGCSTDSDGGGGGANGILTVNNCPSSGTVMIFDSGAPATIAEFIGIMNGAIAYGTANNSTSYTLMSSGGSSFTQSGSFLVILSVGGTNYFKANVSFSNGAATVDFDSMTPQTDLPLGV